MEVTLIDYTGRGSSDPLYAARLLAYTKDTRLEQGSGSRAKYAAMSATELNEKLRYIANTIRSSWEFVDYVFEIRGVTRAFTHQFVRTRTGSYAQQAQRVVAMDDFQATMPDTVADDAEARAAWDATMDAIRNGYSQLSAREIPTQDCRGVLPTNVQTNIIAKFNLRTMADLLGKRKNLRAQGEYGEVAAMMEREIILVHPWANRFLNPERTATPALDALLKEKLGSAGPLDVPGLNEALKELDKLKATWG